MNLKQIKHKSFLGKCEVAPVPQYCPKRETVVSRDDRKLGSFT